MNNLNIIVSRENGKTWWLYRDGERLVARANYWTDDILLREHRTETRELTTTERERYYHYVHQTVANREAVRSTREAYEEHVRNGGD